MNFSMGAKPGEEKQINFGKTKHSTVVPKQMFTDLILKDKDGNNIVVTTRKYGPVVYIEDSKGKSLNMAPIKVPLTMDTITVKDALDILSYPKSLGKYDKKEVKLYKGKYGFYVKIGDDNNGIDEY
mgnify:CR=1 FL=1